METATITPGKDGRIIDVDFSFTDRGSTVALKGSMLLGPGGALKRMVVKGATSRSSTVDRQVTVEGTEASILEGGKTTTAPVGKVFFAQPGYSPVAFQEAMLAYWNTHGRPTELPNLPTGMIRIQRKAQDKIGSSSLTRYSIEGVIWGRETLWTDTTGHLVAEVGCDAEFDHFEAIDEAYTSQLSTFVKLAAEDAMKSLESLSKKLSPTAPAVTAIVGGRLIDGNGGTPIENSVVIVRNGRIESIGNLDRASIPKGATIVDAHGKTVMPGLWDMHAHYEQVEWGPIYLASGVTTARDCGNEFEYIVAVRDAIDKGKGLGPRLLLAGIVDGTSKISLGTIRVDTPEQVRAAVERYSKAGFLQMKIYSSVSPEMVKLVCEEAHKRGMSVTGHIPEGMTIEQGLAAGMDQVNHFSYVLTQMRAYGIKGFLTDPDSVAADKVVKLFVDHHTVLDDTLVLFGLSFHRVAKPEEIEPGVLKVAPELRTAALSNIGTGNPQGEAIMQSWLKMLGKLHKAGVPIVAGTDQAIPGHSVHGELELYVRAGFTPLEALQAATSLPAKVMGVDKEVGTITAGKRADIVIVDGNPSKQISDVRKVWMVMTKGRMFKPAPLWKSVGFLP